MPGYNPPPLLKIPPAFFLVSLILTIRLCLDTTDLKAEEANPTKIPIEMSGEQLLGSFDQSVTLEGEVRIQQGNTKLQADWVQYDITDDLISARGQVKLEQNQLAIQANEGYLRLEAREGQLANVEYDFKGNQLDNPLNKDNTPSLATRYEGFGEAEVFELLGPENSLANMVSYTSCRRKPGASSAQDWFISADEIYFDTFRQTGSAKNARLHFLGQSLPALPSLSFALSDDRISGWLPAVFGEDTKNGFVFAMPYYWNIAPNRDATITPAIKVERGVELGTEFRYLEKNYQGRINTNLLPKDKLRKQKNRWALDLQHQQQIAIHEHNNPVELRINHQRVSDDNYWKDFSGLSTGLLTQEDNTRLLPSEITTNWQQGNMSVSVDSLHWQTLQDTDLEVSDITPPFDRSPHLRMDYRLPETSGGIQTSILASYARFTRTINSQDDTSNGQRLVTQAKVKYPIEAPGWYLKPEVQFTQRYYQIDDPFFITTDSSIPKRSHHIGIPSLSVDSGLIFERPFSISETSLIQTLEPRAYYTFTPYREQDRLPNYDSALKDLNFSSIYGVNEFSGHDRFSASNTLTLGTTSRFLDSTSGHQLLELSVAQRIRFTDQEVVLSGQPIAKEKLSNLLLSGQINWNPQWALNLSMQYDTDIKRTQRSVVGISYRPSRRRSVGLGYRLQRGNSEQLDLNWQWPINDIFGKKQDGQGSWHSVGHLSYDQYNNQLAEAVLGLEYDAECWKVRFVTERLQLGTRDHSTRYLLQLELVGLSHFSFGSDPLDTIREHIPHYE
jgi:LPS-assembly protein